MSDVKTFYIYILTLLLFIPFIQIAIAENHAISTFEYLTLSHKNPKDLTNDERNEMSLYELGVRRRVSWITC